MRLCVRVSPQELRLHFVEQMFVCVLEAMTRAVLYGGPRVFTPDSGPVVANDCRLLRAFFASTVGTGLPDVVLDMSLRPFTQVRARQLYPWPGTPCVPLLVEESASVLHEGWGGVGVGVLQFWAQRGWGGVGWGWWESRVHPCGGLSCTTVVLSCYPVASVLLDTIKIVVPHLDMSADDLVRELERLPPSSGVWAWG